MPETEETSEASAPKHRLALGLLAAVLLPVLYVLSFGPMLLILQKTHSLGGLVSDKVVNAFYAPLFGLEMQCPWFFDFVTDYCKWFGV